MELALVVIAAAGFWLGALYVEGKAGVRRPENFGPTLSDHLPGWERLVLVHYTAIRAAGLVTMWLGALLVAAVKDTDATVLTAIGSLSFVAGLLLYLAAIVCAITLDPRNRRTR